jgi:hypothetical protein
MKKILSILVLGTLMACLVPAYAQSAQEWQSTSTMQTSGSVYTPQVTAVGATTIAEPATTTESSSPAKASSGPRRAGEWGTGLPEYGQGPSPIGDAVLPLMLMALAFGGVVALRKRRKSSAA